MVPKDRIKIRFITYRMKKIDCVLHFVRVLMFKNKIRLENLLKSENRQQS